MTLEEFTKQARGPRTFDCWEWARTVDTAFGPVGLMLVTDDQEAPPDVAMLAAAAELCTYAQQNSEHLLDVVYAHYLHAEAEDWLSFWNVPTGLPRNDVLRYVDGVQLDVRRLDDPSRPYDLAVSVRIRWDQEYGLYLIYQGGGLVSVNDDEELLAQLEGAVRSSKKAPGEST